MKSWMQEHGQQARANGYTIIPIAAGGKAPGEWDGRQWRGLKGWTSVRATERDVDAWGGWEGCGIGFLCGPIDGGPGVIGIDLDVDDPDLLADLESLAADMLGKTESVDPARRVGSPGRSMLIYRVESDVRGSKVGGRHGVEVMAAGRQFVGYHVHPVTLQPYTWTRDPLHEVTLAELPVITQEELDAFLAEVARYLGVDAPGQETGPRVKGEHPTPTPEAVRSAAAALVNAELGYDDWVQRGLVIRAAYSEAGLSDAEGSRAWETFSATSSKDITAETSKKWSTFRPTQLTSGSLFALARMDGWQYDQPYNVASAEALEHGREVAASLLESAAASLASERVVTEAVTGDALLDVLRGHVSDVAPEPAPELLECDGLVGDIAAWIVSTAPKPQPWLALGAALATVAVLTGRRYAGPTGLRGNLLVLGSAPSGAGKEHPRAAAKEVLHAAGLSDYVGGSKIASDQGLLSSLQLHAARLFAIDEFGETLGQLLSTRAGSHQRAITSAITELFTSAGGTHEGTDYANTKDRPREPLHQPHACFLAMSAGEPLWEAIRTGNAVSGFLARWMLFATAQKPSALDEDSDGVGELFPPAAVVSGAIRVTLGVEGHDYRGPCNPETGEEWSGKDQTLIMGRMDGGGRPVVPRVPWGNGAKEEDQRLRERVAWLQDEARGPHAAAVLGRTRELALKVAMIRAVGCEPDDPAITGGDIAWARAVVEHCQLTLLVALERFVGDSESEQNVKRVLDLLRKGGAEGVSRNKVTRALHRIPRRLREDALRDLVEAGSAVARKIDTGGRTPREVFWASEHDPGEPIKAST